MQRNCLQCKKEFKVFPCVVKVGGGKYCSYICRNNYLWAQKDYREHMSKVHVGLPLNIKKLVAWSKSEEGRKLNSIRNSGSNNPHWGKKRPEITGPNNYNWIADRSKLKTDDKQKYDSRYKIWMLAVKRRDGWKCKISNIDCNGRLEAHHILTWKDHPELRYEENNGITLCVFHHPRKREEEKTMAPFFSALLTESQTI